MKTKLQRTSRRTISIILVILLLSSALMIDTIVANAGGGKKDKDWYMYNSIEGSWDSGGYLLNRTNGDDMYYDFYFKKQNYDIYWRYWSTGDNNKLGARTNNVEPEGGNDNDHRNGLWGSKNSWKYNTNSFSDSTKTYRVRIHLDPDGGDTSGSYAGWTWVTAEALNDLSTSITTKKTNSSGSATTTFNLGETVYVSASTSNGVGSVTQTIKYKKSTDTNWTTLSGSTFTPASAGTYTIQVTAEDGGVIPGTNAPSGDSNKRTKVTTKDITVTKVSYSYTAVANPVAAATVTPASGTVDSGSGASLTVSGISYNSSTGGYKFVNWTATNGKFGSTSGSSSTETQNPTFYPTANNAVATANFALVRKISLPSVDHATVTATYYNYKGVQQTGANALTEGNTAEAKYNTTVSVTVTPDYGYKLTNVVAKKSSDNSTVSTKTSSPASFTLGNYNTTYVVNIEEDTSTNWKIYVTNQASTSGGGTKLFEEEFLKNSGQTTQKIGYLSLNLNASTDYYFKVYDSNNDWYGNNGGTVSDETEATFSTKNSGNNTKLTTTSAGTYVFKIDYSTASQPKITVTFPSLNINYGALSNGTYGDKDMTKKAGKTVSFKVKPNAGYYVKDFTVNNAAPTSKTISDTADSNGYITCTFTMPNVDASVAVVFEQFTITASPNYVGAGKITNLTNASGTALTGVSVNSTTGVASVTGGGISVGDTFIIYATATSNMFTLTNNDLSITKGTKVDFGSLGSNLFSYVCTLNNGKVTATVNFRAQTPTVNKRTDNPSLVAGSTFKLSDIVEYHYTTKLEYHWEGTNTWTVVAENGNINCPNERGTKNIYIRVTNDQSSVITGDSARDDFSATINNWTLTFTYAESHVNLYVDTHGMSIEDNGITMKVYDSTGQTVLKQEDGVTDYGATFGATLGTDEDGYLYENQQSSGTRIKSTIYAAENVAIPRLESGANVVIKVTVTSTSGVTRTESVSINKDKLPADNTIRDIWLETVNRPKVKTTKHSTTSDAKTCTVYLSGDNSEHTYDSKRIYILADKTTYSDWPNNNSALYVYWWDDNVTAQWNRAIPCTKLSDNGNDKVFYADIPQNATHIIVKKSLTADAARDVTDKNGGRKLGTNNCFRISNGSDNNPTLKAETKVVEPFISKYYDTASINMSDTGEFAESIKATYKTESGMSISYTSSDSDFVTVNNSGIITPVADTNDDSTYSANGVPVTITLTGKYGDTHTVQTNIKVTNTDIFDDIPVMSYESYETNVFINSVTGNASEYPAEIKRIKTNLTGTVSGELYTKGVGIVTLSNNGHTATIKYAKPSTETFVKNSVTHTYNAIAVKAQILADTLAENPNTHNRYGFYDWFTTNLGSSSTPPTAAQFATILSGTKSSVYVNEDDYIDIGLNNYVMHYDPYKYTDIAVTFYYYKYNPKFTEDGKTTYKYFFNNDYYRTISGNVTTYPDASSPSATDSNSGMTLRDHHEIASYTRVYEYRYESNESPWINGQTQISDIKQYVSQSAKDVKDNYYTYSFEQSDITNQGLDSSNSFRLNINVILHETAREYTLTIHNINDSITTQTGLKYQEYVTANSTNVGTTVKWYEKNDNNLLATGPSYRFRISGDTTLQEVAFGQSDVELANGNASTVSYVNNEFIYDKDTSGNDVEYLAQNFFINHYFNKEMKTYTPRIPNYDEYGDIVSWSNGTPVPYDDITFVGAGVFYYSTDSATGKPKDLMLSEGYVFEDEDEGVALYETDTEVIGDRIKSLIEDRSAPEDLIEEDIMEYIYSQPIGETLDVVRNQKTGLVYRYLPANTVTTETKGSGASAYSYISSREFNTRAYRYSSLLNAYQLTYPVYMKNLASNTNKKMRLHSFYIFSYVDYSENNNGETRYEIVVSQNYAKADTYVASDISVTE